MINLQEIGGALASTANPKAILEDLDDEELGDLRDETENPELLRAIDEEIARRASASKTSRMGTIVWLVVIATLVGLLIVAWLQ